MKAAGMAAKTEPPLVGHLVVMWVDEMAVVKAGWLDVHLAPLMAEQLACKTADWRVDLMAGLTVLSRAYRWAGPTVCMTAEMKVAQMAACLVVLTAALRVYTTAVNWVVRMGAQLVSMWAVYWVV